MERPKYLEYRHRRGNIQRFQVKRTQAVKVERPAAAILRLVGKKTSASTDTFEEEWSMELRTTDVKPDYSGLVKTQITEAVRIVKGERLAYESASDPTTLFLNETVDRYGGLSDHHGSLLTPQIFLFPDDPKRAGEQWTKDRQEIVPISGPDGQVKGHEARTVTYQGRVDSYGMEGDTEVADIAFSGRGVVTEGEEFNQVFEVTGKGRFAIRDGYVLSAELTRSSITTVDKAVITVSISEKIAYDSSGEEKTVGGMRI